MEDTVKKHLEFLISKSTAKNEDETILQPYVHIATGVCSAVPHKVVDILNYWLNISDDKQTLLREIIDVLCNSALLLDDIQDNSSLRRGRPTAHLIYGIQKTVAGAALSISLAINKLFDYSTSEAVKVVSEAFLNANKGQTAEIYWRDNYVCPSEEDYILMIELKTGAFFNAVVGLMQLFSENKADFSKLMNLLGVYFQILDDYGNLRLKQFKERKGYCEDLTEGKFGFPIIHAINSHPEDERVLNIVKQRTRDDEVKKTCVKILEEYGSFEYTKRVVEKLGLQIREETKRLGGNPVLEELLDRVQAPLKNCEMILSG